MKNILKTLVFAALAAMTLSACDKAKTDEELTSEEKALKAAVGQYVPNVIYKTYGSLADETETLYKQLSAMKQVGADKLTQTQIDAVCTTFKNARSYWEKSEAFLFGAASQFKIDPHIDSWPLDKTALANNLSNAKVIASLDADGGAAIGQVGESALGFHGIEFILFRDGKNRSVADFKGTEQDEAFKGMNVTGQTELIFATAVAEDLMGYCFELQVSWDPDAPAARRTLVEDELELNTTLDNGLSFGENMLSASEAGSTFRSWQAAVSTILVAGCSNIAGEVADTKIGSAYYHKTQEDADYIESPYSKRSYIDFRDNIYSIQYTLYGALDASAPHSASILSMLKEYNPSRAASLEAALKGAIAALDACVNSGVAFVDNPTATVAEKAMEAIGELDDELNDASDYILTL